MNAQPISPRIAPMTASMLVEDSPSVAAPGVGVTVTALSVGAASVGAAVGVTVGVSVGVGVGLGVGVGRVSLGSITGRAAGVRLVL